MSIDEEKYPMPVPKRNEVLVKVEAIGINPIDCARRAGYGARLFRLKGAVSFPMVLGTDFSGVVEAVGSRVKSVKIGDSVFGAKGHGQSGTYAEYVAVNESELGIRPRSISSVECAAIPYAALTSLRAITNDLKINSANAKGKKILVTGGAGAVGVFAIQLLRHWGAEVSTTCSERNIALCKSLGAMHVVDYEKSEISKMISNMDAVLDTVGNVAEADGLSVLKKNGQSAYTTLIHPTLANIDKHGVAVGIFKSLMEFRKAKSVNGKLGIRYAWTIHRPDRNALNQISEWIDEGIINPVIDSVYAGLENIPTAHSKCETRRGSGKIVVKIS